MTAEPRPAGPLTAAEQTRLHELLAEPGAPAWAGPLRAEGGTLTDACGGVVFYVAATDRGGRITFRHVQEDAANLAALARRANAYAELVPLVRRLLDGPPRGTEVPRGE